MAVIDDGYIAALRPELMVSRWKIVMLVASFSHCRAAICRAVERRLMLRVGHGIPTYLPNAGLYEWHPLAAAVVDSVVSPGQQLGAG